MTRDVDTDAANLIPLDQEALDCAAEGATAAAVAGHDLNEQLEAGIRAYLWAIANPPT